MGPIELLFLAVLAAGIYGLVWRWWLRPLLYAVGARQLGWALIIAAGGPIAGGIYLYTHVDSYVVPSTDGYARGDNVIMGGRWLRVLKVETGSLRCLNLGERRLTAVR